MTTEAEAGVYPLSSPDGQPIPFDVGHPNGLFIVTVAVAASAEKTLPDTWELVTLLATVDTIVGFGAAVALTLAEDVEKVDHVFVPAGVPTSIKVPAVKFKTISADGVSVGKIYMQKFRRWQALTTESLQSRIS